MLFTSSQHKFSAANALDTLISRQSVLCQRDAMLLKEKTARLLKRQDRTFSGIIMISPPPALVGQRVHTKHLRTPTVLSH